MSEEPEDDSLTENELEIVARYGRSLFTRCLATVQLAKKQNKIDEVEEMVEDKLPPEEVK